MYRPVFICGLLLLAACSNSRFTDWNPADYTVVSGDTVYSIAWRYELDPFELARWNDLVSPYIIHPGQRLRMREVDRSAVAEPAPHRTVQASRPASTSRPEPPPTATAASSVTVREGDTLYGLATRHGIATSELARINRLKSPYLLRPGQVLSLQHEPKPKPKSMTAVSSKSVSGTHGRKAAARPAEIKDNKITWSWPLSGAVVNRFNRTRSDSKGIDIAGREGSPVRAAAPGKVVYSGNGLISYGNLVIIKHNRNYLSAYAYNRSLLVAEGDSVSAGQVIAELGRSGAESPRLHFEIRKNGKPVNPLTYLPSS